MRPRAQDRVRADTGGKLAGPVPKANRYAEKFAGNGKALTFIGLAFLKERRTIVATEERKKDRG